MQKKNILSAKMNLALKEMKGFRNILVHEYATIDDELVFRLINTKLEDFREFKQEVLNALKKF